MIALTWTTFVSHNVLLNIEQTLLYSMKQPGIPKINRALLNSRAVLYVVLFIQSVCLWRHRIKKEYGVLTRLKPSACIIFMYAYMYFVGASVLLL